MAIPLSPGGIAAPGGLQALLAALVEPLAGLTDLDLGSLDRLVQGRIAGLLGMLVKLTQQALQALDLRLDLLPEGVGPLTGGPDLRQLHLERSLLGLEPIRSPPEGA